MSTLSEAELHVQAMRLVCEALADREQQGIEVDWDVINQQLDHMDVILQGIADQRVDDADEIKTLRKELDVAQAETVDVRRQRNNETDRLNATNAVSVQQRDEIAYLRARLDEERSVSARLRQQLDAANAAVTLQRAGIERLQAFFERVRCEAHEDPELYIPFARLVLQFNAGSIEPAPCQGCERLRAELADEEKCRQLQVAEIERLDAFVSKVLAIVDREYDGREFEDIANALAELDAGTEPAPVAEPLDAEGGQ